MRYGIHSIGVVVILALSFVTGDVFSTSAWASEVVSPVKEGGNEAARRADDSGVPSEQFPDVMVGDLRALVVGVSKYKDHKDGRKVRDLTRSADDAKAFAAFLRTQNQVFRKIDISELIDEDATGNAIQILLSGLPQEVKKDDTLILFFSGHGEPDFNELGDYYFLPHDASLRALAKTSIKLSGLDYLKDIPAKRIILIADACYSGSFTKWGTKSASAGAEEAKRLRMRLAEFRERIAQSAGTAVLTSSGGEEESREYASLENSLFTHFLLQGLRGEADRNGDGIVTLFEAYEYAKEEVKRFSNGKQNPVLETKQERGSFPLSFVGESDPRRALVATLFQHVASGRTKEVEALLRKRDYLKEERDPHTNRTPLIVASEEGHADLVELLLSNSAVTHARDYVGDTALIVAARRGHLRTVEMLLSQQDVDVHDKNQDEDTALHSVCRLDKSKGVTGSETFQKIAKLLLEREAKVDARNNNGSTPLGLATEVGDLEMVKILLEHGADPNAEDNLSRTPFITACRYGHRDVVKLLLAKGARLKFRKPAGANGDAAGPRQEYDKDDSAGKIIEAAITGDSKRLQQLLQGGGVGVNIGTISGDRALILAAALGYTDVVSLLLDTGAQINKGTATSKTTPLMWAAYNGKSEVVKLLAERGADIDQKNNKGFTPLLLAAEAGQEEIVKFLRERGANLSQKSDNASTALTLAADGGFENVVKFLLDSPGVDLEARIEGNGSTALLLAVDKGHARVAKLLLEKGANTKATRTDKDLDCALTMACRKGDKKMVQLLLEHGADVNSSNRKGPAIVLATAKGHKEIVELLLSHGAKVEVKDGDGFTVIQIALRGGYRDISAILKKEH